MESDEMGIPNPAGLAFSPRAGAFHVVEARQQGQPTPAETDIIRLTPFSDRVGTARIAAAIQDPINMAFDSRFNRLLIFQFPANQLIEVLERPGGNLEPGTLIRHDARHFGLGDPQGMTVDPASGHVFILDATGPRIVGIEPGPGGSFDNAIISEVDLRGTGLVDPRSLAFDPSTGHLHVYSPAEQTLYELNETGQILASRDLSEFGLSHPHGMVFALSGDSTDDPAIIDLYIADSGPIAGQSQGAGSPQGGEIGAQLMPRPGQIVELSFTEAVPPSVADFVGNLVQIIDTSAFTPSSPDTAGIAYINASNTLLFSDSEVDEMLIFTGDNLFEMTTTGNLLDTTTTTIFTKEPTGVAYNPANGHVFISDDDRKEIYEVAPGPDSKYGTIDDTVTSFDTEVFNCHDPEGVTFDSRQGVLFIVDGVNSEVYRVSPGANGVFDGVPHNGDDQVTSFDTLNHGIRDPEGIAFNSDTGSLYVVGKPNDTVAEFTTGGALVQMIDISAANADKPAGLAYAPGSLDPNRMSIFITERGVDNNSHPEENDGKVYELTLPPTFANDDGASTVENTPVTLDVIANDSDPKGNLDPTSANTYCGTCADPHDGTLADHGDGIFTYTPARGFLGSDSFLYEICDTDSLCDTATVNIDVLTNTTVLVGAGDIAGCGSEKDLETALLLDNIAGTVFTLGDNVYPDGTDLEFSDCYDPTWGRHKARTRPAPGNHDYHTPGAIGYFNYFGAAAGEVGKGYYSYDVGDWHIIVLNSECSEVGGCDSGSAQWQWLQADLAANPTACTLAYWHHPRFSSGSYHGSNARYQDFWQLLYAAGADVVLNGHDHTYERFAPQDPSGSAAPGRGIREFVVGTGGAGLYAFGTPEPNSEVREGNTHGVLKLTLHATSYDWEFIPIAGQTFTDSGSASCVVAWSNSINVPGDALTIQAGIDLASDGEVVLVAPGEYHENIEISDKTITLASWFYATQDPRYIDQTIIDGDGNNVITVNPTVGSETRIIGFTIQNGNDGIKASASLHILNNRFTGNKDAIDYEAGGGICRSNVFENNSGDAIDLDGPTEAIIENNILRNSGDDGIEIRLHKYSGPTLNIIIRRNIITGSREDAIQLIDYPDVSDRVFLIERNVIEGSAKVGVGLIDYSNDNEDFQAASVPEQIHLFNNTFIDNDHGLTGGGNLIALNNIFVGSTAMALKNVDGGSIAAYNLFWGNGIDYQNSNVDTATTILENPHLNENHWLMSGSPAIDMGTAIFTWNSEIVLDLEPGTYAGVAPDLGAYEAYRLYLPVIWKHH